MKKEYLKYFTTERNQVISKLEEINKKCSEIYQSTIIIFEEKMPQYPLFVAHGVREIINNLTREFKTEDKKEIDKIIEFLNKILEIDYFDIKAFAKSFAQAKDERTAHGENIEDDTFEKNFKQFEIKISELCGSKYLTIKDQLDTILDQPLSEENQKILLNSLHYDGIKYYLFSNLEQVDWIDFLLEKGLLDPEIINDRCIWIACYYLEKISNKGKGEKKKVFAVLNKLFLKKNINEQNTFLKDRHILIDILKIANLLKDEEYLIPIGEYFKKVLEKDFYYFYNIDIISNYLQYLVDYDSKLAFKITELLLRIEFNEKNSIEKCNLDAYLYNKFLKQLANIYQKNNGFEYFKCLYYVLKNSLAKFESHYLYRAAIENHSQNSLNPEHHDLIVNAIIDCAEEIIKADNSKFQKVLKILEDNDLIIFKRIIIHLLRFFPTSNVQIIEKYLKDYFDNIDTHHEHYLLIAQEFGNCSNEFQQDIFQLIEEAIQKVREMEARDEKDAKRCKYCNFYPIKNYLPQSKKEEFFELQKEFGELEHPEFNIYCSGISEIKELSPLSSEELANMSFTEIIKYLNNFENPKIDYGASEIITTNGLLQAIEADIKKDPAKYTKQLEILEQLNELDPKIRLLRSMMESDNSFYTKDLIQSGNLKDHIKKNIQLLQKFSLEKDDYLETKLHDKIKTDLFDDNYHIAINSYHGNALMCLFTYCFWLYDNKHFQEFKDDIYQAFNELLKNSYYNETWAVFGSYMFPLQQINKNWLLNNLNKIFPEDNKNKFYSAFISYLRYSDKNIDMCEILLSKSRYFFNNMMKDKLVISELGEYIALLYIGGLISIDDEMITILLKEKEYKELRITFLSKISSTKDVMKAQKIWKKFRMLIKEKESEYQKELGNYIDWFRNNNFDPLWLVKEFHSVITFIDFEISRIYTNEKVENVFLKAIPNQAKEILYIFEVILKKDLYRSFLSNGPSVLIKLFEDIQLSEYSSLKEQKDHLINLICSFSIFKEEEEKKFKELLG